MLDVAHYRSVNFADSYLLATAVHLVGYVTHQTDDEDGQRNQSACQYGVSEVQRVHIEGRHLGWVAIHIHLLVGHELRQHLLRLFQSFGRHPVIFHQQRAEYLARRIEERGRAHIVIGDAAYAVILIHPADGLRFSSGIMRSDTDLLAYGTTRPSGGTLHIFRETAANHHLLVHTEVGVERTAVDNRNLHQFEEALTYIILVGTVEEPLILSGQHHIVARRTMNRYIVTIRHHLHFRQTLQFF